MYNSTKQLEELTHLFMKILAIETSFDDCCVALLKNGKILQNLKVSLKNNGLIPKEGEMHHQKHLPLLLQEIKEYDAICCTRGPGQSMCLRQGWLTAIELSQKFSKPLMGIHHMEAHCLSPLIDSNVPFPYLCFIASGGHTQLVKVHSPVQFELLSDCLDDSIGEAYDKVARLFNTSAPEMCKLIYNNKSLANGPSVMRSDKTGNFSFSGLKSAIKLMKSQAKFDDFSIMSAFQKSALDHVQRQISLILRRNSNFKALTGAGGALMNSALNDLVKEIGKRNCIPVYIPKPLLDRQCCYDWLLRAFANRSK